MYPRLTDPAEEPAVVKPPGASAHGHWAGAHELCVLTGTHSDCRVLEQHLTPCQSFCVLWSASVLCSQNKKSNKDLSGHFKYAQKYSVKASFDLYNQWTFLWKNKGPETQQQYQYGLIFNCGYGFHNTCVYIKILLKPLNKENIQTAYFWSHWLSKIVS